MIAIRRPLTTIRSLNTPRPIRPCAGPALHRAPLGALRHSVALPVAAMLLACSGAARATDVSGTSPTDLQTALNGGGTVDYASSGTSFVGGSADAVFVTIDNTTLEGTGSGDPLAAVTSASSSILSQARAQKTGSAAALTSLVTSGTAGIAVPSAFPVVTSSGTRNHIGGAGDCFNNNNKLLVIDDNVTGLTLTKLHIDSVTVVYTDMRIVNGLIGNRNSEDSTASMRAVTDNAFTNLSVTLDYNDKTWYLAGGGVLGLRSTAGTVEINDVSGNIFSSINVTTTGTPESTYLEGGGVIGLDAVSSPADKVGHANLETLKGNYFTSIHIKSDDLVLGGGLVGVNNNSQDDTSKVQNTTDYTYARIGSATNNIFAGDITVSAGTSLRGGGVIGLNGLSNASVELGTLAGNVFSGVTVDAGTFIRGGGIVGLASNDNDVADLSGLTEPDAGADTIEKDMATLAAALQHAPVTLTNASDNLFLDLTVTAGTSIDGGGIIGLRSGNGLATLETANNNIFKAQTVTVTNGSLTGGGIIGVSSQQASMAKTVTGNYFDGAVIKVSGGNLRGGGLVGISTVDGFAMSSTISDNTFTASTVDVSGRITGGGFVGAGAENGEAGFDTLSGNSFTGASGTPTVHAGAVWGGGIIGAGSLGGNATIATMRANIFKSLTVEADHQIMGGGIIGLRSDTMAAIGTVSADTFSGNTIKAGTYIDGGGIIGVTGASTADPVAGIQRIENSVFSNNTVTAANGHVLGGAVYSYGAAGGFVISDSSFLNNTFSAAIATPGDYDGTPPDAKVYGTVTVDTGSNNPQIAGQTHVLTLEATSGHSTIFRNNAISDAGGNRFVSLYFGITPELTTDEETAKITVTADPAEADASLIVDAKNGGTVALYDPIEVNQDNGKTFNMEVKGSGGDFIWGGDNRGVVDAPGAVTLDAGSTTTLLQHMSLDATRHAFNLNSGGRLNVSGRNTMTLQSASLNGTMDFNLDGTTVNDSSDPLLTIHAPQPDVSVSGATVVLSNLSAGRQLTVGDEFYLIRTDGNAYLSGDPANNSAYVRQGLTMGYDFIIDKKPTRVGGTDQWLVARLAEHKAARETKSLLQGHRASLDFFGQRSSWLADHSYQSADMAFSTVGPEKNWVPFGGVDASWSHTNKDGRVDVRGVNLMAGVAARHRGDRSDQLYGLYLEGGVADYTTRDVFPGTINPLIRGHGVIRYIGPGIMARQEWHNGFRLEGSLRGGWADRTYRSDDYRDANGTAAAYDFKHSYVAAHVGAGYTWKLDDKNSIDFTGRTYYFRQSGGNATLSTGEPIHFAHAESRKVRAGARYIHKRDERTEFYAGAAVEYEFDGAVRGSARGFAFDPIKGRGASGVFDVGLIVRPLKDKRFSAEIGIQAYVGRVKGVTAGIRLGWQF
ncbi:MAG: autotransporter outer membrane beta-barrel domain-containing protein [Methylobacteriaceae bacterium]|jgi:hypothetical protein|nr:autotransporter outer membrane beta-barrel domain-containing protein [Methylobacteriaceae bacterium]